MHTNHRRKNKYNPGRRRWYTRLATWKRYYWEWARARERNLISHGRFDDLQDRHPKDILWDAL